jgi:hypothetical protein
VLDNGITQKAFRVPGKNLQILRRRQLGAALALIDLGGMAVGAAENQCQQQDAAQQGFDRMFCDEGGNTHQAISLR